MDTPALAMDLRQLAAADRELVGGKGASLGELLGAGVSVPPGFVVTAGAFTEALAHVDPDGALRARVAGLRTDQRDEIERVCAQMRERMLSRPLPRALHDVIAEHYAAIPTDDGDAPVAVRSSATAEDGQDTSFAGLQDSYLWLRGQDTVVEHVRRCWASLYSVESVTYRRDREVDEDGLAMAVVVQLMVDARASGVMFTCSPTTGDRSIVAIEAGWGLGSAMVSGEVTPDTYQVNKVTGEVVKRAIATKARRHRADPAGDGVLVEDVPPALRDEPCLTPVQLGALVAIAKQVEHHYGAAQDVEWAIPHGAGDDVDGAIMLLQSRPETVWSGRRSSSPLAAPREHAYDHVLDLLSGGLRKAGGRSG